MISAIGSSYDALIQDLAGGCKQNRYARDGKVTTGSTMQMRAELHRRVKLYCLIKNITMVDLVESLLEAVLVDDPILQGPFAY